jgi:hypothetical protein
MRFFSLGISSLILAYGIVIAGSDLGAAQPAPQNTPAPAPAAQTDIVTSITPEGLAAIMRDAGYKADVYEYGTTTKHKARVYFYSCDAQNKCGSLNFETSFTKSPNFTVTLANKWNTDHRYTKLYIDPTDQSLTFDFDIFIYGGVTNATVKDAVTLYDSTLGDLAKFLP